MRECAFLEERKEKQAKRRPSKKTKQTGTTKNFFLAGDNIGSDQEFHEHCFFT
jgi:hypothetical protein